MTVVLVLVTAGVTVYHYREMTKKPHQISQALAAKTEAVKQQQFYP